MVRNMWYVIGDYPWDFLQLFFIFSFIMGIVNLFRKKIALGVWQLILSPVIFWCALIFSLHRDWVNGNELSSAFFVRMLASFDYKSYILLSGIILLVYLFVLSFKKQHK